MKKFLFLILLISVSVSGFSQTHWFKATHYAISSYPDINWSQWYPVDIVVAMNAQEKHIEIANNEPQIIDYEKLEVTETSTAKSFSGFATDANYKTIFIVITFFNSGGVQLTIVYGDLTYKYKLILNE